MSASHKYSWKTRVRGRTDGGQLAGDLLLEAGDNGEDGGEGVSLLDGGRGRNGGADGKGSSDKTGELHCDGWWSFVDLTVSLEC